ncbi:MAG: hypothetical protein P4L50_00225 [Anaerolineaceae bacterium]|nr:hypothetical protein [Anaerolineaceae bacterium]
MSDLVIQASFNSGEWSPNLFARVDLQKYKSGAALLQNFFIDYRGGASSRMGSKYVLQAYKSATAVRLIQFQAAFNVGYVLEFGANYIRFFYHGSPILETGINITAITNANPCVVTAPSNAYNVGDWIYISNVSGMPQIDGNYYSITNVSGNNLTLADLNGNAINSTSWGTYTSGGTTQRVYTITTPYAAADLALIKYAQIQNEMILCHPDYPPYVLTLLTATNWTLAEIVFGATATPPTGVTVSTTLSADNTNYSYIVTSIDPNGQESTPSAAATLTDKQDIRTNSGTNSISWTPGTNAVAYNIYESQVSYFGVVPAGMNYGFIGTCTGTTFIDSNIGPDFSEGPPVAQNPFAGEGIANVSVTVSGTYTTVPTATTSGGSPQDLATLEPSLGVTGLPAITAGGSGYAVNDIINYGNSLSLRVTGVSSGAVTSWAIVTPGSILSGSTPTNPISQISTTGSGTGATATATWGVLSVIVIYQGLGYTSVPSIAFSFGSATATATLTAASNGNPSVPSFFQQRLVLAAPSGAPQTFNMSQPGDYYNFNITDPVEADNAITETLVTKFQQNIKSIVSATAGMLVLTDTATWLVNGGSSGSAVSPTPIVANPQSFIGANDIPPIQANFDVLYCSAKSSSVRDLAYNIYFNVFTGTDISQISSHLFFGYTITSWAWAESPFYNVWAVRSDGVMLTLTFLKEQEFIAWSHQVTQGTYQSDCVVTETTTYAGNVDAVYTVVKRTVNGNTVQYIERTADRVFPNGLSSAWCVDAGIQYTGSAQLSFQGAQHLAGLSVTGLTTDNLGNVTIITPFTMPVNGEFTLPAPTPPGTTGYTTVTVGLSFTCQLQTLAIDISQAPIQGKLKHIPYVDVRVKDTLGLQIGASFSTLVNMKDLQPGAISSMQSGLLPSVQVVNGLYSGDARTILDPSYNVYGQYCIQQSNPYPATILGVFPCLSLGDID